MSHSSYSNQSHLFASIVLRTASVLHVQMYQVISHFIVNTNKTRENPSANVAKVGWLNPMLFPSLPSDDSFEMGRNK